MDGRRWIARHGFWLVALLWLPAGVVAQAALRFGPSAVGFADSGALLVALGSLALAAPCGLPLALGCRRLKRLGYRRGAWVAGIVLGALTVLATLVAGLLGPVAIIVSATVLACRHGAPGYGSRGTDERRRQWAGCGASPLRARPSRLPDGMRPATQ